MLGPSIRIGKDLSQWKLLTCSLVLPEFFQAEFENVLSIRKTTVSAVQSRPKLPCLKKPSVEDVHRWYYVKVVLVPTSKKMKL